MEKDGKITNAPKLQILLQKNPLLFRLIGLSPFLALTHSLLLSLTMGILFLVIFCLTSSLVSATRYLIPPPAALASHVVITSTVVTVLDLSLQAWFPDLRTALGIYLPIMAANCLILDRTMVFASQNTVSQAFKDAVLHSLAVLVVLILLGSFRELISHGSLMKDLFLLTNSIPKDSGIHLIPGTHGFPLAKMPAGAFLSLALLIAAVRSYKKTP